MGRVKARTAAHSTSDSSLPALCYPGKSTGNGQSVVINQDPLPIILVSVTAIVIIEEGATFEGICNIAKSKDASSNSKTVNIDSKTSELNNNL